MNNPIVILGGGVSGLAAAYKLQKAGLKSVLLEKNEVVGGLASSYKIKSYTIERFYHHIFSTDKTLLDLIEDFGIEVSWKRTKMGFFCEGKLYDFSSPAAILKFKPLSPLSRIKFILEMFKIKIGHCSPDLDNQNAEEWITETFNEEIYHKIFRPLLSAKFAMSLKEASAAFVHGRLKARVDTRAENISSEFLGYVEGGYEKFTSSFLSSVSQTSDFRLGCEINKVKYENNEFEITFTSKDKIEKIKTDKLINTLPLEIFGRLVSGLPDSLNDKINSIKYQAVICATVGMKRPLSNYYWTNISSTNLPFQGIIEHTNFISADNYEGDYMSYLFNYVDVKNRLWSMSEEDIRKVYIKGLTEMFPDLKLDEILWFRLSKERFATPIFLRGYKQKMEDIEDTENLYFAGGFKIYPNSRNVNNVIETGYEAAEKIIEG